MLKTYTVCIYSDFFLTFKEHSIPFLQPVPVEEAPDYPKYISHPMDLQTMTEKLIKKEYKSMIQFKHDLDLIWQNCFQYNKDVCALTNKVLTLTRVVQFIHMLGLCKDMLRSYFRQYQLQKV